VAGLESTPSEGMRTPRYDKDTGLKNLSKPGNLYLEDEMEMQTWKKHLKVLPA
jgi:hypothetical protein